MKFSSSSRRPLAQVGMILLLSVLTTLVGQGWFTQFPHGLVRDDGFFYSQMAYNIGTRGFSSFDVIHHTDGYHQLWMYLLGGLAAVVGIFTKAKAVHMVAYLALNFALVYWAALLATPRLVGRAAFVLLMVFGSLLMEGHLWALLIVAGVGAILAEGTSPRWIAPLCVFLLPITRVDTLLVMVPLLAAVLLSRRSKSGWLLVGALVAGVAAHLLLMVALHGHLATVSSTIKAAYATKASSRFLMNVVKGSEGLPIPVNPLLGVAVALGAWSAWVALKMEKGARRTILLGLWIGAAMFTSAHLFITIIRPWYFLPAFASFFVVASFGLANRDRERLASRWEVVAAGAFSLLFAVSILQGFKSRDEAAATREFFAGLDQHVKPPQPIYMVDGSGYAGWISPYPIVNGDGLVNDHAYAKRIVDGTLGGYLEENSMRYFVTNSIGREKALKPGTSLIEKAGLRVTSDQAELVAEKRGNGRFHYTQLLLWRLR